MTTTTRDRALPRDFPLGDQTATAALQLAPSTGIQLKAPDGRVAWLDSLRILAILAVITIHTVSPITAAATVPRFSAEWWAGASMNVASLWCVPVFVLISGGLLLRRPAEDMRPVLSFYRRRMHRIGVPLVVWTAVYLALRPTAFGEHITTSQAAHDLAIGHPYLQMYYLFVIAGLYAVTPVVHRTLSRLTTRRVAQVAIAVLAFNVADYTLGATLHAGTVNALTEWLPFLGFFIAGRWLISVPIRPTTLRRAALVFVSSLAATILLTALFVDAFGWTSLGRYFLGYQSPTVVLMSCSLFVFVRARAETHAWRRRRSLTVLGQATFGVFLVHPLLLVPLLQHAGRPSHLATILAGVPAIVLGVAAVSAAAALALGRVPVLRRVVS